MGINVITVDNSFYKILLSIRFVVIHMSETSEFVSIKQNAWAYLKLETDGRSYKWDVSDNPAEDIKEVTMLSSTTERMDLEHILTDCFADNKSI